MKNKVYFCLLLVIKISPIFSQQATLVEVDKVVEQKLNETIPIIGSVESKKNSKLMAAVSGKIDRIFVDEGSFVKKGQILAYIDNKNYEYLYNIANANVEKAKAAYESSKLETENNNLDLNIMKALKNSSAFNNAKYDKLIKQDLILKTKEKIALSELKAHDNLTKIAKLNLEKSKVRAAFNGVIEELFIEEGEVANIGSPLFNLIDRENLEILAEVPSYRVSNLTLNTNVDFYTTDNMYFSGKIKSIGSLENKKTRTTKVFLDFQYLGSKGQRSLLPGESINLLIPISRGNTKLTVHKDAILKRQGMSLAYIVKNNKVEIRPLELGDAVGNRFIVREGLEGNDIVVTKGNERLRPGQVINIIND